MVANHRVRIYIWCPVLIALMLLAMYAGLPTYAFLWHVVHGSVAKCGAWTIPIPTGWWARSSGCELVTPSPAYTLKINQKPAQVFVTLDSAPSVLDPKWREDVQRKLRQDGYSLNGTKDTIVAGAPTVCFEFKSSSGSPGPLTIACDVDKKMVVTFFYANSDLKARFYEILSSIKSIQ